MRFALFIFLLHSFIFADQYTFLLDEYDKEMELEAKILSQIAKDGIKTPITLFIPDITKSEKKVYGKFFSISENCKDANLIFVNKNYEHNFAMCEGYFFTNNYKKLIADERFFGALFWSKSRPNIIFIKKRLKAQKITLPENYNRYIEELQ